MGSQVAVGSALPAYVRTVLVRTLLAVAVTFGCVVEAAHAGIRVANLDAAEKWCAAKTDREKSGCDFQPRVWAATPIASIQVGIDEAGKATRREIYVASIASLTDAKRAPKLVVLQTESVTAAAQKIVAGLDAMETVGDTLEIVIDEAPSLSTASFAARQRVEFRVGGLVGETASRFRYTMRESRGLASATGWSTPMPGPVTTPGFELVLIDTYCKDDCATSLVQDSYAVRYEKLAVFLGRSRSWGALPPQIGYRATDGVPVIFSTSWDAPTWPGDMHDKSSPSAWATSTRPDYVADFERMVKEARSTSTRISFAAVETAGISSRGALAVTDVLDDAAYISVKRVGKDLSSTVDELARSRLLDCVRLRGGVTKESASACSGYKVSEGDLTQCLNGGPCYPTLGDKAILDLLVKAQPGNLKLLATSNMLPRVPITKTLTELKAAAGKCAGKGMNQAQAAHCLLQQQLKAEERACLDSTSKPSAKLEDMIAGCLKVKVDAKLQESMHCVSQPGKRPADLALCAAQASLPAPLRDQISCSIKAGSASALEASSCFLKEDERKLAACLSKVVQEKGAISEEALKSCPIGKSVEQVACLMKAKDTKGAVAPNAAAACMLGKQEAAIATCLEGNSDLTKRGLCLASSTPGVPAPLAAALSCVNSADSTNAAAACVAAQHVQGEAGRLLNCAAQTSFDGAGTAVCFVGDKLPQTQLVMLQCAVNSGGEPTSTSACVVGQLAMAELGNCKDKKFGEGDCFGENNEFMKMASKLGFELGPKSLMADYVNFQLLLWEAPMNVVEKPLNAATNAVSAQSKAVIDGYLAVLEKAKKGDVVGASTAHLENVYKTMVSYPTDAVKKATKGLKCCKYF